MTTLAAKRLIMVKGLNPKSVRKITTFGELQSLLKTKNILISSKENFITIEIPNSNYQNSVSIIRIIDNETIHDIKIYELT